MKLAQELRLGNLIKDHTGKTFIVDVNLLYAVSKTVDPTTLYLPIPLTEEWLLNAGFNQESIFGYHVKYSFNKIEIWHDRGNGTFLLDNIKNKKVYLKYVHQLQNICFELGQELTFKM